MTRTQLAGQPDARQFNFVRHKGNYLHPLTHSLHFLCVLA